MTSMAEDKKQILELVKEYYNHYHKDTDEYTEGDRIAYAGRVYEIKKKWLTWLIVL